MIVDKSAFDAQNLTSDAFLGGKVIAKQPKRGFRSAIDAVLLAAACPATSESKILDLGCGVGVAGLCVHARIAGIDLHGLEMQAAYLALAQENAAAAGARFTPWLGDAAAPPPDFKALSFDHVLTNPPYFDHRAPPSPRADRDAGMREQTPLSVWLDLCLRRLRPFGSLTVIHDAARAPDILSALTGRAGGIALLPVAARQGRDAKRVIIRAIKESRAPFRIAAPLILHEGDAHPGDRDHYAARAAAILRDGAALDF